MFIPDRRAYARGLVMFSFSRKILTQEDENVKTLSRWDHRLQRLICSSVVNIGYKYTTYS